MVALVELYEPHNLERVLDLGATLVGINNRNLQTFVTDLGHTLRLRAEIPADRVVVGESGIHSRADVLRLQQAHVDAMLVGEHLMAAPDIGQAVGTLLGSQKPA
jgi:indole-3-glycerol phosphate synthase